MTYIKDRNWTKYITYQHLVYNSYVFSDAFSCSFSSLLMSGVSWVVVLILMCAIVDIDNDYPMRKVYKKYTTIVWHINSEP